MYPLWQHERDTITSKTGKKVDDITVSEIINGNITHEDIKISKDVLQRQAYVAAESGRTQLGENFERASELVDLPDDLILNIYNKLRPNRATKQELLDIAKMLRESGAKSCAQLVDEAIFVYEKRGILL